MNAAWGGISEENEMSMCIADDHKTAKNAVERGAFTVSMGTEDTIAACDYVGIVSGNKEKDKFAKAGFHAIASGFVDAPLIAELPMAVECRLKIYDPETCRMVGEVVNVCAEESILTDGKIDPAKLRPIVFDGVHHSYHALGEKVGKAFSDGLKLK